MSTHRIALCIVTHFRANLLRRLLISLQSAVLEGDRLLNVTLIVVNNGIDSKTTDVCEEMAGALPFPLTCVPERRIGYSAARNKAVAEALKTQAELVAFLDDDDIPQPDWLMQLVAHQQATGADMVSGCRRPSEHIPQWALASGLYGKVLTRDRPINRMDPKSIRPKKGTTANLLVTRPVLETLSRQGFVFDPMFNKTGKEDGDFFKKVAFSGYKLSVARASITEIGHAGDRLQLSRIWKQGFRGGLGDIIVAVRYRSATRAITLILKSLYITPWALLQLVLFAYSKPKVTRNVHRLARSFGLFYAPLYSLMWALAYRLMYRLTGGYIE